jgi:hypothetical protein
MVTGTDRDRAAWHGLEQESERTDRKTRRHGGSSQVGSATAARGESKHRNVAGGVYRPDWRETLEAETSG